MELIGASTSWFIPRLASIFSRSYLKLKFEALEQEMEKLESISHDVLRMIEVAATRGEMRTIQVERWLRKVREAMDHMDQIREAYRHQEKNLFKRRKLRKIITLELERVFELISRDFEITNPPTSAAVQLLPVMQVGIQGSLEQLKTYLHDDKKCTIGIVGMGGMGKTTLLIAINNKILSSNHDYDLVIFITVTKQPNIAQIQVAIAERIGLIWKENESMDIRAARIFLALQKVRFALLLDDIWEPIDLGRIGVPAATAENRCKVLLTTRSREVCIAMKADEIFHVQPLYEEEAWELFTRCLGGSFPLFDDPVWKEIARGITKKCMGLPLALTTIGRALRGRDTIEEWRDALNSLDTGNMVDYSVQTDQQLSSDDEVLFSKFLFTYNSLGSEILKECLLYCSLFPEKYWIQEEELIYYWIGEGFFEERAHGREHIQALKDAGFLQGGGDSDMEVSMHDTVHKFVLYLTTRRRIKGKFLVETESGLAQAPPSESWEDATRVSLMCNDIKTLDELPYCVDLRTLIIRKNSNFREITDDLFHSAPALQVMDMAATSITSIPRGIVQLAQLGYLNLSFTRITSLPKEVGELVNLKHLDLTNTDLLVLIPGNVISKLLKLLFLNMYESYGNWQEEDNESSASIAELERLERMSNLGITICNTSAFRKFSRSSTLKGSTRQLTVKGCQDPFIMHLSTSFKTLQQATIKDCFLLKELVIGGSDIEDAEITEDQFLALEVLHLQALYRAKIICRGSVPGEWLRGLRVLNISFCHEVSDITWVLQLQQLQQINLNTCQKMEHIVKGIGGISSDGFPKLKTLILRNLPELKSICEHTLAFPALESLHVLECHQLTVLPLDANSAKNLRVIRGTKDWWNDLDWENKSVKSLFYKYFQSDS
ncbi:hypothetical protein J5N97_001269 [Dioscorea zingiberensis]|uniref:AAA+ ATPase domain-containing protein n=1 Tax=Dioscorea zingiberensis TaxID=325984 RepID=A0A9D5BUF9_9LILI|nr:hypothetical protein J5N97_001269 [Dioscorea zingiberensis]